MSTVMQVCGLLHCYDSRFTVILGVYQPIGSTALKRGAWMCRFGQMMS